MTRFHPPPRAFSTLPPFIGALRGKRDFMQLVSVDRPDGEGGEGDEVLVEYDVEWLAIVKASHFLVSDSCGKVRLSVAVS